jgi:hypothetical protein
MSPTLVDRFNSPAVGFQADSWLSFTTKDTSFERRRCSETLTSAAEV